MWQEEIELRRGAHIHVGGSASISEIAPDPEDIFRTAIIRCAKPTRSEHGNALPSSYLNRMVKNSYATLTNDRW